MHLYLTDYRALYVGDVIEVTDTEPSGDEEAHVPGYYRDSGLRCDLWFRLADIRRLVVDDTLGVVEELKKLRNVHYNDRPVSIYGGMVDLPLVVTRPDGARFFDADERATLAGDRLWAEFDAELGTGIAVVERDLRDNRFGESLWYALEPAARVFVATAERLYRDHRADASFDFSPVLTSLAKAMEVQGNALLRRAAAKLPPSARLANVEGRTVDLTRHRALTLGQLAHALSGERELSEGLGRVLESPRWFRESFPAVVAALAEARNEAAHSSTTDRETAAHWRNRLVGIGCEGDLVALARTRVR